MNNEEIKKFDQKIKLAQEYADYLKIKHKECYDLCGYFDVFIPDESEIEYKIQDFKYFKEVLEILNQKKIKLDKKIIIMPNVYLSIFFHSNTLTFYTYLEDDSWFYDNFISSHSGLNEWLMKTIEDSYDLYSGNSEYNYAFGTRTLRDYRSIIENKKEHNYDKRPFTAQEVANAIESLIKFFSNKKNPVRNAIVKDLNFKFNTMKKLITEED